MSKVLENYGMWVMFGGVATFIALDVATAFALPYAIHHPLHQACAGGALLCFFGVPVTLAIAYRLRERKQKH